jgi:SNF2 family DNA or RNA helicase
LEKLGYKHGAVTGDISTPDRMEYIRRFQEADLQFMVVTLGAGGEGITLTAAQTMVRLQRSYSLVQNKQVEDRLHRIGQEGSVNIIDVVTKDTVEEPQLRTLMGKEDMFEEIVRDAATLLEWMYLR